MPLPARSHLGPQPQKCLRRHVPTDTQADFDTREPEFPKRTDSARSLLSLPGCRSRRHHQPERGDKKKGSGSELWAERAPGKRRSWTLSLACLFQTRGCLVVDDTKIDTPELLDAWRDKVAYVPQNIFLTDASFAENIAFGVAPDKINQAKVEACAKVAQIHDIITQDTPDGYASRTGERGTMLSGGQRQRVGIARASTGTLR